MSEPTTADLIAQLSTIHARAQERGALSSGGEAWLIDNLGHVIARLQAAGQGAAPGAGAYAGALAGSRADVARLMQECGALILGRDALAAEVHALTRDLLVAIAQRDTARRERDAAVARIAHGAA